MIHGIYMRTKPKFRWLLVSTTTSNEMAEKDLSDTLRIAKDKGYSEAEVCLQSYESSFFIPETLKDIKKESELLYN